MEMTDGVRQMMGEETFTDGQTSQRIAGKEKSSSSPVIFVP